ncbi:homocysteine S-methyltransferase [Anaerotignum sp.]|uniref:homocysteine S-methyltransferase n=1 Tax=Anaerotignum sp. TaxID=2039241 RepID=UPI002714DA42|nr:homocysteine S-methyltransferase [Anaerotignum sp.]
MNPIEQILSEYSMMILDGAFSTELERRGCDLNDPLWSTKVLMENPDIIGAVHEDYFKAGADCAITASYQATYEGFMKRGMTKEEAKELIQLSVRIATKVRDTFWGNPENRINRPKPIVAASVGPYGAFVADGSEYRGNYGLTKEQLEDFHRERMETLIEAGPDILACETIPCLVEAQAVVNILEEHSGMYAWISFSAKDGMRINSGEPIVDCARWLDSHPQVAAIGVNCTPPEFMESLISEIRKGTNKPIVLYPNSGEQYDAETKTWHGCSSGMCYGDAAKRWYKKGARLIGGCCRTTPEDIHNIALWSRE